MLLLNAIVHPQTDALTSQTTKPVPPADVTRPTAGLPPVQPQDQHPNLNGIIKNPEAGKQNFQIGEGKDLKILIQSVTNRISSCAVNAPSLADVQRHLSGPRIFPGAARYAPPFFKAMSKQGWRDRDGQPISNWKLAAEKYANTAEANNRTGRRPKKVRNLFFDSSKQGF
ncbi:MAG: hypothetical protein ACREFE_02895 [Limisphaerales bacterium]